MNDNFSDFGCVNFLRRIRHNYQVQAQVYFLRVEGQSGQDKKSMRNQVAMFDSNNLGLITTLLKYV